MDNQLNRTDFNLLVQSYRMGFVYSWEFINLYHDFLLSMGAGQELSKILDLELQPLANYLADILEGSGNLIEDYRKPGLTK